MDKPPVGANARGKLVQCTPRRNRHPRPVPVVPFERQVWGLEMAPSQTMNREKESTATAEPSAIQDQQGPCHEGRIVFLSAIFRWEIVCG